MLSALLSDLIPVKRIEYVSKATFLASLAQIEFNMKLP